MMVVQEETFILDIFYILMNLFCDDADLNSTDCSMQIKFIQTEMATVDKPGGHFGT